MDYETMLKKAVEQRPKSAINRDRFEVPKVQGHVEGTKTVLSNLNAIAQTIRREPAHFQKFLLKELATPGIPRSGEFLLGRKISSLTINEKIRKYVDAFVICPVCGLPDTDLMRDEKKGTSIKCNGCGSNSPIKDFM
ncbi:MAG TPA: translation initiation factor IF-2 subunit beta [Acidobacteriota bacterium]|nr:translation initiation factor IF-2 subunit beta [Acidobacteriota bacterium]